MRRNDKEIRDRSELESIMETAAVCRIGLSENNIPYVVPVNYGYKENRLYFHAAPQGKKIDIIRQNNHVCFEIDIDCEVVKSETPCAWGMRYRSVIGFGKAFPVQEFEEKKAALNLICAHYSGNAFDFTKDQMEKVAVFRVEIESMTGKKSGY